MEPREGDKVIYLGGVVNSLLTINKSYNIKLIFKHGKRNIMCYVILNDINYFNSYSAKNFISVSENRLRKLKRLGERL